jgi:hypothetical protein
MQLGRRSQYGPRELTGVPLSPVALDALGWICSEDQDHFRETAHT